MMETEKAYLAKDQIRNMSGYTANTQAGVYAPGRGDIAPPDRAITIPVCIDLFEKVAAQLHDSIANLEARLTFVLRPSPEQKHSGPDNIPTSSDIAARLVRIAEIVNQASGRINDLNHRLDL